VINKLDDGTYLVILDEPRRAVTVGQVHKIVTTELTIEFNIFCSTGTYARCLF